MAIGGFMHNIQHGNRPFHVETEYYGGGKKKLVVTVIYEGGTVLKKISTPPESEEDEACQRQMANQHKQALKSILAGELDTPEQCSPGMPQGEGTAAKPTETETATTTTVTLPIPAHTTEEAASTLRELPKSQEPEDMEKQQQKDAAHTVSCQLRELSTMLGFVGLGIYTNDGEPLLVVESGRYALREQAEDFNNYLRNTHHIAASKRMGRVQSLFLGGEDLCLVVMFFPPDPNLPVESTVEILSHILLFMRREAPWGDAEKILKDLMEAIQIAPRGLAQWLKQENETIT